MYQKQSKSENQLQTPGTLKLRYIIIRIVGGEGSEISIVLVLRIINYIYVPSACTYIYLLLGVPYFVC